MITNIQGYIVGNPSPFSHDFQIAYTPEQIAEFLIDGTKFGGVVIIEPRARSYPILPSSNMGLNRGQDETLLSSRGSLDVNSSLWAEHESARQGLPR